MAQFGDTVIIINPLIPRKDLVKDVAKCPPQKVMMLAWDI
jgi:hypothetical protein